MSPSKSSSKLIIKDGNLKRDIGLVGLLFAAVGSTIGSGWLFGALSAAQQSGPSSIISWIIGAVMIMLIGLTYAELSTMFPLSGGVARFPHFAFGSFASFITGWITWLAAASFAPIEVEAALQYAASYLPWLQHVNNQGIAVLSVAGYFVAAGMMLIFCIINLVGVRWFARLNNVMVWWKIGVILLVVFAFVASAFHSEHFSLASHAAEEKGGFLPFGWHGVFSSVATAGIIFSFTGFRQGVELAGETDKPSRNVPVALIGSVIICCLLYLGLQIAFIGALPQDVLAHGWDRLGDTYGGLTFGPLAELAMTLGLSWLALLLYIDAFVSPSDSGMVFTTITARISYAMGRNENAPKALAKVNKHGVPWIGVILAFIVGMIFFLPFPGWQELVGFVTSATVLSFASGPLALVAMRKELPGVDRPFKLRFGLIISYLAFLVSNLIVYWSGWDKDWKLMLAVLLGIILLTIHEAWQGKKTPKLNFRAGMWIIPWLIGLTIISYLGNFPEISKGAGNLGLLNMWESTIVIALFSALIMWIAYWFRLPAKQMRQLLKTHTGNSETA